jgi:tetratricopeptide (TPR) repeat protein
LLPKPDTTSIESLFVAAKRLQKLGERARALAVARQASHLALQGVPPSERRPGWYQDYTGKLGQISATLTQLGAYDDAIAVVQSIDPSNRAQYYVRALMAAAREPNSSEVGRLFPVTMEAFRINPMIQSLHLRQLSDLARALAVAGYRDFAVKAFREFQDQLGKLPAAADQIRQSALLSAVMQADSGDIDGAILAAENAGPMIGKPTDAQLAALAAMMAGGRTTPPNLRRSSDRQLKDCQQLRGQKQIHFPQSWCTWLGKAISPGHCERLLFSMVNQMMPSRALMTLQPKCLLKSRRNKATCEVHLLRRYEFASRSFDHLC